jgi:two-component system, cell cycle sensor histidine kinase and response regulator CckA
VCILVVDDELAICSCIAEFLRQEGFDVEEASDAFLALVIARSQGGGISAVVADVNMPGMDGIEMWKRMQPLVSPRCKILFMSGLAHKLLSDGFKLPGELLQKPFSLDVLLNKLSVSA